MANEKKCPYLIQEDFHGLALDMCLKGTGLVCDQCRSEIVQRNWINPACRKPDNGEKVLCYTVGGFYEILTKIPDGWRCGLTDQEFFLEFVQSWQPLPKPPSGASKMSSRSVSYGCSTCKHRTNCKDREKCGRENGSGYESCKPSPKKEEKRARLTKFSKIIEHYGSGAQLGKLMLASAHLLIEAGKCLERGIEISDELNEHAAEVVALIMQIYTHAPLYWVTELEKAIDEIIEREIKKIEVENEKNT